MIFALLTVIFWIKFIFTPEGAFHCLINAYLRMLKKIFVFYGLRFKGAIIIIWTYNLSLINYVLNHAINLIIKWNCIPAVRTLLLTIFLTTSTDQLITILAFLWFINQLLAHDTTKVLLILFILQFSRLKALDTFFHFGFHEAFFNLSQVCISLFVKFDASKLFKHILHFLYKS